MRRNSKRRVILSARARANRRGDDGSSVRLVAGVIAAVAAVGLLIGGVAAFTHLRALWEGQCVLTDVSHQVTVETGSHVKAGVILDGFGLTNGANLARIDFTAKRRELLERIPNIRTLAVSRRLPDRVEIAVGEREPVARMNVRGQKAATGRVVDAEGVVFMRRVGTGMLPTIREARAPGTAVGRTLPPRARAALALIRLCREDAFSSLGILEVDLSKSDYLLAVLGNYQRAKIAWEGMDEDTAASRAALAARLTELQRAVDSNIAARAVVWNATQPGRPTADTREPIP